MSRRNTTKQDSGANNWIEPNLIHRGSSIFGVDIGVILLDTDIPRPIGDIGNARSFDYPILYETACGASTTKVVEDNATGLLDRFVEVGQRLIRRGVSIVSTSCGFVSIYQYEMAERIDSLVATSALLQIPMILQMLSPNAHVGVITANASTLREAHLMGAGITSEDCSRLSFKGLENTEYFYPVIVGNASGPLDTHLAEKEVVAAAKDALTNDPAIRAFVLECTNLPPYSAAIRAETQLPVWDVRTMLNWIEEATNKPTPA